MVPVADKWASQQVGCQPVEIAQTNGIVVGDPDGLQTDIACCRPSTWAALKQITWCASTVENGEGTSCTAIYSS